MIEKGKLFTLYIIIVVIQTTFCFGAEVEYPSKGLVALKFHANDNKRDSATPPLLYINTGFENASPMNWELNPEGEILLNLVYDRERSSTNKSISHWHFQVQAKAGADLTFIIQNHVNIYNGRTARVSSSRTHAYVSGDGMKWRPIKTELVNGNSLKIVVHMEGDSLYLAGVEPYRLSDLEKLLARIKTQ